VSLNTISSRIRYDIASGAYVETFEYTSVLEMILGVGTTDADREVVVWFTVM
jgi:hypothetical protein